jgi:hypothetical protein
MSDLVSRYVQQVGRYLPSKERKEVEAELRSQIQDQLEAQFEGVPSQADTVAVLAELGDPRKMATSYGSQQYLIGPELYPTMIQVLRRGLTIVPVIAIIFTVIDAMSSSPSSSQPYSVPGVFFEAASSAVQTALTLVVVIVVIFAILQNSGQGVGNKDGEKGKPFNPLELPLLDDPHGVDRTESTFDVASGAFFTLVLLYFLQVGGLTLRFNLSNPGEVIPVPLAWIVVLIITTASGVLVQLWALWRNQWSMGLWLADCALELLGAVCVYFVFFKPIFDRVLTAVPQLANLPFMPGSAEIVLGVSLVIVVLSRIVRTIKMWHYRMKYA